MEHKTVGIPQSWIRDVETAANSYLGYLMTFIRLAIGAFRGSFRWISHLIGLLPLSILLYEAATDQLTINPIQYLTFRTGKAALIMVVITLACTPANTLFKFKEALKARRTFGLYTFLYAFLHVSIFVGLDYYFDFKLMIETVLEKRYILVGLGAFIIFLLLALTSFKWWMKRLGKNWKRLHRLVYLGALLAVVHYTWLVKADIRVPLLYGAGIVLLLVLRIPAVQGVFSNLHFRRDR